MDALHAPALPPGGTIGIASPASPYTAYSDVRRGVAWWHAHGYHVTLAPGALERTGATAGSPQTRARDLMALFADPAVDAIQCLRGGTGAAEVIPHLDFDAIAAHPKAFIGFSNITALHTALLQFTGLVTFYGPGLIQVATASAFTIERMLQVLGGQTTGPVPRDPDDPIVRALAPGAASGRMVGGSLADLLATLGTPWEVDLDDAIFVFEELDSSPPQLEAALLRLAQAGKLARVHAVAVGDLAAREQTAGGGSPRLQTMALEEVLTERLGPLGVPMLSRLPFGHGARLATIPLGVQATVDAQTCTLVVTEPALKGNGG